MIATRSSESVASVAVLLVLSLAGCSARGVQHAPENGNVPAQQTAERLVAQLGHGDDEQKGSAGAALAALGEPAVPALCQALQDPDEDVRVAVVDVLEHIAGKAANDCLAAALTDPSSSVRQRVVEAFGNRRDRAIVPVLIERYGSEGDAQVRYEILTSLGAIGDPAATDLLVAAAADQDPYARQWAIDALCEMDSPQVPSLALRLLDDQDVYVRRRVLRSCGKQLRGEDLENAVLRAAVYENDFENSVWARRHLANLLASGLDPNLFYRVRKTALTALRAPSSSKQQRIQAAFLLTLLGERAGEDEVIDALRDPNVAIRQNAAFLLGRLDDGRVIPALARALGDPEPVVQATAHQVLAGLAARGDARAQAALKNYKGPTFQRPLQ